MKLHRLLAPTALILASVSAAAQDAHDRARLSFEVATIKPSGASSSSSGYGANHPEILALNRISLKLLIAYAYDLADVPVFGGDEWTFSKRFDVVAKAPGPATSAQKRVMLKTLLAERFHLVCHEETRAIAGYALIVAKNGPKYGSQFRALKPEDPESGKPSVSTPGTGRIAVQSDMGHYALLLSNLLKRPFPSSGAAPEIPYDPLPVVDATELAGEYEMTLDLSKNRDWGVVLREQLGLSLVRRKVEVRTIVIDHAVQPGEN